jgi:DNA-binding beta-propeller fold protein YncE
MYVTGAGGDDVNEYDLSSAWDISTASYVQNFSVAAQETGPRGLSFKPDGTKMYLVGIVGDDVNEYSLSTAWDISSASYVQNFSLGATGEGTPESIYFKEDGSMFFMSGSGNDRVYQYFIGGFSVAAQEASPTDLFFKPDGTKMYVIGFSGDYVNEYSLSTAWDVSSASYVQNFSVASQETNPQGLFFKPDGTKMFIVGGAGDDVNEYSLSSAWDISTASYVQNFSVSTQDITPSGLFFKPDGTKMYVTGATGDDVNEFGLSSAWDISTASYTQNFSVASQDTQPLGLFFKPDGTKMYIIGSSTDTVCEYDLSSAWDISTASYVQNFSIIGQEAIPSGLSWKEDGTQFWIIGSSSDRVFSYLISEE